MIIYSVNINIKKKVEEEWLEWMKNSHVSDVINTGYFNSYNIYKKIIPAIQEDEVSYVINYETNEIKKYNEYMEKESRRLQEQHVQKFEGLFTSSRSVMELI